MTVHIPNRPLGQKSKNLEAAIRETASRLSYSSGAVALVVSHFFEQITLQVVRGNAVLVRGFGCFGSRTFRGPASLHGNAVPTFVPARGLRHEVRNALTSTNTTDADLRRFRKRNRIGSAKGRGRQRVWTAQVSERQRIVSAEHGSVELD